MLRRDVMKLIGGAAAGALPLLGGTAYGEGVENERVVILGGGFAGAHAASRLKAMAPELDVLLVDRNEDFLINPLALDHVFGKRELAQVVVGYDGLKKKGVRVARADVRSVDASRHTISTSQGEFPFTRLVLATGCRFAFEDIEGIAEPTGDVLSLYDRARLDELRRRISALSDETVVVGIPDSRLVCPPAPYEFVLLLAESIRQRGLKARIIVLDGNIGPQPEALAELLKTELNRYADIVEYVHSIGAIESVDTDAKTVKTRFGDEHEYAWLALFPRASVAPFVRDIDLIEMPGAIFAHVDPLTMRTAKYPDVFAVGDVAQIPYGKSAYSAVVSGELCARTIAADIGIAPAPDTRLVNVACFPHTDERASLSLKVEYDVQPSATGFRIKSAAQVKAATAEHLRERNSWLEGIVSSAFGHALHLGPT